MAAGGDSSASTSRVERSGRSSVRSQYERVRAAADGVKSQARQAVDEARARAREKQRIERDDYKAGKKVDYERRKADLTGKNPNDLRLDPERPVVVETPGDTSSEGLIRGQRKELREKVEQQREDLQDKKDSLKSAYDKRERDLQDGLEKLKEDQKQARGEFIANELRFNALDALQKRTDAFTKKQQNDLKEFNKQNPKASESERDNFAIKQYNERVKFNRENAEISRKIREDYRTNVDYYSQGWELTGEDRAKLTGKQIRDIRRFDEKQTIAVEDRERNNRNELATLRKDQASELKEFVAGQKRELTDFMKGQLDRFKQAQKDAFDEFKKLQEMGAREDARERTAARAEIRDRFREFRAARSVDEIKAVTEKLRELKEVWGDKSKLSDDERMDAYLRKQAVVRERSIVVKATIGLVKTALWPAKAYAMFAIKVCEVYYIKGGMKRDPAYIFANLPYKLVTGGRRDLSDDISKALRGTYNAGVATRDRIKANKAEPVLAGVGGGGGGETAGSGDTSDTSKRRPEDTDDPFDAD